MFIRNVSIKRLVLCWNDQQICSATCQGSQDEVRYQWFNFFRYQLYYGDASLKLFCHREFPGVDGGAAKDLKVIE